MITKSYRLGQLFLAALTSLRRTDSSLHHRKRKESSNNRSHLQQASKPSIDPFQAIPPGHDSQICGVSSLRHPIILRPRASQPHNLQKHKPTLSKPGCRSLSLSLSLKPGSEVPDLNCKEAPTGHTRTKTIKTLVFVENFCARRKSTLENFLRMIEPKWVFQSTPRRAAESMQAGKMR